MGASTIDMAVFSALRDSVGAEFVTELVDAFLEEAPLMLSQLREALAASNADAYRRAAHSLKSNSNTFGAHALGDMARDIELGGFTDPAADATALDALDNAYAAAAAELNELARD